MNVFEFTVFTQRVYFKNEDMMHTIPDTISTLFIYITSKHSPGLIELQWSFASKSTLGTAKIVG